MESSSTTTYDNCWDHLPDCCCKTFFYFDFEFWWWFFPLMKSSSSSAQRINARGLEERSTWKSKHSNARYLQKLMMIMHEEEIWKLLILLQTLAKCRCNHKYNICIAPSIVYIVVADNLFEVPHLIRIIHNQLIISMMWSYLKFTLNVHKIDF